MIAAVRGSLLGPCFPALPNGWFTATSYNQSDCASLHFRVHRLPWGHVIVDD